jgi:hypothetical protein
MDPKNWTVTLKQPTVVHDVLRHPMEGALPASEKEAQRLFDNNLLTEEPQPIDAEEAADDGEGVDELGDMKLEELGILVTKEGVPLHGATKKADIVAAIRAHRAGKEA